MNRKRIVVTIVLLLFPFFSFFHDKLFTVGRESVIIKAVYRFPPLQCDAKKRTSHCYGVCTHPLLVTILLNSTWTSCSSLTPSQKAKIFSLIIKSLYSMVFAYRHLSHCLLSFLPPTGCHWLCSCTCAYTVYITVLSVKPFAMIYTTC